MLARSFYTVTSGWLAVISLAQVQTPQRCWDPKAGKWRQTGETWTSGKFVKTCDSGPGRWATRTTHCVTRSGKWVPIGESVISGDYKLDCYRDKDGVIKSKEWSGHFDPQTGFQLCSTGANSFKKNGDTWVWKYFIWTCDASQNHWRIVLLGCIWPRTGERINIGNSASAAGATFYCYRKPNRTGKVFAFEKQSRSKVSRRQTSSPTTYVNAPASSYIGESRALRQTTAKNGGSCSHFGTRYHSGALWIQSNFQYQCLAGKTWWKTQPIACVTNGGIVFAVDSTVTENSVQYECFRREDGMISIRWQYIWSLDNAQGKDSHRSTADRQTYGQQDKQKPQNPVRRKTQRSQ